MAPLTRSQPLAFSFNIMEEPFNKPLSNNMPRTSKIPIKPSCINHFGSQKEPADVRVFVPRNFYQICPITISGPDFTTMRATKQDLLQSIVVACVLTRHWGPPVLWDRWLLLWPWGPGRLIVGRLISLRSTAEMVWEMGRRKTFQTIWKTQKF